MRNCRSGKIDKVLCISITRLSRNTVDALNDIRELKDKGIGMMLEAQNIETSAPDGGVAIDELNALDEHIRKLQREMMELHNKKISGRIIPFSYAKQGSKLVEKIDALKTRKNEFLEAQCTNEQIKQRLNDINDVLDKNKPNKEFNPNLFKKLVDEIIIND